MASLSSIQFVDAAFFYDGPLALSYIHPDLKWLIRESLLSLFGNFPSLKPSVDMFTYDDGTTVKLLNLRGFLTVSQDTVPVPLTIWIHQNYPFDPPLVYLSLTSTTTILQDHPFVDLSGSVSSPYIHTWVYPRSNLVDLVRNLVHIFTYCHPFIPLVSTRFIDPSLISKMEALDFLFMMLHYDIFTLRAKAKEDIEGLWNLQPELEKRADILKIAVEEFEHNKSSLRQRVKLLTEESDVLINWLRVNGPRGSCSRCKGNMGDAFEIVDKKSSQVIDCLAEDKAIEDMLYVLDNAVKEGVITVEQYLKQVKALARDQFFCRAKLVKLRRSDILQISDDLYGSVSKCK